MCVFVASVTRQTPRAPRQRRSVRTLFHSNSVKTLPSFSTDFTPTNQNASLQHVDLYKLAGCVILGGVEVSLFIQFVTISRKTNHQNSAESVHVDGRWPR